MINTYELERQKKIIELKQIIADAQENFISGVQLILMMANKNRKLKQVSFEMMQFEKNTKGVCNV